jgi:tetratricopeptide (TPR) repeat protein
VSSIEDYRKILPDATERRIADLHAQIVEKTDEKMQARAEELASAADEGADDAAIGTTDTDAPATGEGRADAPGGNAEEVGESPIVFRDTQQPTEPDKDVGMWESYIPKSVADRLDADQNANTNTLPEGPQVQSIEVGDEEALGVALAFREKGDNESALKILSALVDGDWTYWQAALEMSHSLYGSKRFDEAIDMALLALSVQPHSPEVLYHLGNVCAACRRYDEAGRYMEKAAVIAPGNSMIRWNLALHRLKTGDWLQGFRDAQWGKAQAGKAALHPSAAWDGGVWPSGTLYVYPEQGQGDQIMAWRLLPQAKKVGGFRRLVVEVVPHLVPLLMANRHHLGVDAVYAHQPQHGLGEVCDQYISAMDLFRALRITPETVSGKPYLGKPQVERPMGFRIGFCHKGNPAHPRDADRSLPIAEATTLLNGLLLAADSVALLVPDCEDFLHERLELPDLRTWKQTTEAIASLDMVVTVDTAVAHVCGAMGIPCLMLVSFDPDWRWSTHGQRTPLYDSVRIYRQESLWDWTAPVHQVIEDVQRTAFERESLLNAL